MMVKHDDWRSVFSRSGRRNFKDLHEGQKHSLGPLIITTGVPLSGAGPLLVQNCTAGVPREAPPPTSSRTSSIPQCSPIDLQTIILPFPPYASIFAGLLIFSLPWGGKCCAEKWLLR